MSFFRRERTRCGVVPHGLKEDHRLSKVLILGPVRKDKDQVISPGWSQLVVPTLRVRPLYQSIRQQEYETG